MADLKITELTALETLSNNDLFVVVDVTDTTMEPSGTDKKITAANVNAYVQSLAFSPFSAKPTTFAELQSAFSIGGFMYVPTTITMTDNLTSAAPTVILFASGAQLANPDGHRIDTHTFNFTMIGTDQTDFVATYIPANEGESFTYDSVGSSTFALLNGRIRNGGALADTPVSSHNTQRYLNASVVAGSADNAGVNLGGFNNDIDDLQVISAPSPASTRIFISGDASGAISKLSLVNEGSVTGTLATISFDSPVSQLDIPGGGNITIGSSCSQLKSSDDSDVNLTVIGGNTSLNGIYVASLDMSGSSNATITGSYCAGTYTPHASTRAAACTGSIINTTNPGLSTLIPTVTDSTFALSAYAGSPGFIVGLGEQADSIGTAGTVSIEINGTPVTGLTAVAPTTSGSYTLATGNNLLAVGDKITATFSGTTAVLNQNLSLRIS